MTVGLALVREPSPWPSVLADADYLEEFNVLNVIAVVVTALTAGSAFLMWIGERITEKGVGNGISIVLVINIISRIPSDLSTLLSAALSQDRPLREACWQRVIIAAIIIGDGSAGHASAGCASARSRYSIPRKSREDVRWAVSATHIPLKVNTAGVIPVIFASVPDADSGVLSPLLLGYTGGTGVGAQILRGLSQSNWFDPNNWIYTIGACGYILLLIIGFAYFYTSITFNPLEIADNMKKQGGFIPGIRPGKPTSRLSEYHSCITSSLSELSG